MKITRITYILRDIPFVTPLVTAKGTLISRAVIYVAVHAEGGLVGVGEAAPLPDFGTESVADVLTAIEGIAKFTDYPDLNTSQVWLGGWVHLMGSAIRDTHTLFFALHCAVTSLMCQYHEVSFPVLASRPALPSLPVNGLVSGTTAEDVLTKVAKAVDAGFSTVKIKLGVRTMREDVALVLEVRRRFPELRLRVDANGAWSLADAREFLFGVMPAGLEFVEEPLSKPNADGLTALRKFRAVPLALDETLSVDGLFSQAMKGRLCDVFVLKPMRHGSITSLAEAAERAGSIGSEVVVSSLMETELGLSYLANLAAVYGSRKYAHGLATSSLLTAHTLNPPLRLESGALEIPDIRTLHTRLAFDIRNELGMV